MYFKKKPMYWSAAESWYAGSNASGNRDWMVKYMMDGNQAIPYVATRIIVFLRIRLFDLDIAVVAFVADLWAVLQAAVVLLF